MQKMLTTERGILSEETIGTLYLDLEVKTNRKSSLHGFDVKTTPRTSWLLAIHQLAIFTDLCDLAIELLFLAADSNFCQGLESRSTRLLVERRTSALFQG